MSYLIHIKINWTLIIFLMRSSYPNLKSIIGLIISHSSVYMDLKLELNKSNVSFSVAWNSVPDKNHNFINLYHGVKTKSVLLHIYINNVKLPYKINRITYSQWICSTALRRNWTNFYKFIIPGQWQVSCKMIMDGWKHSPEGALRELAQLSALIFKILVQDSNAKLNIFWFWVGGFPEQIKYFEFNW